MSLVHDTRNTDAETQLLTVTLVSKSIPRTDIKTMRLLQTLLKAGMPKPQFLQNTIMKFNLGVCRGMPLTYPGVQLTTEFPYGIC